MEPKEIIEQIKGMPKNELAQFVNTVKFISNVCSVFGIAAAFLIFVDPGLFLLSAVVIYMSANVAVSSDTVYKFSKQYLETKFKD